MMSSLVDLVVIGGGINGCGIAADASMRGLKVILIEKNDLASKTSSSSTKLIHGGLRYLEHFNFSLVKKSLDERQILLNVAPHLVRPLPLILPYQQSMRAAWMLRAGLFFYDHLSRLNQLPKSQYLTRTAMSSYFSPLIEQINKGFLFYDAMADDARLTLSNALQAKQHGATVWTQTELMDARTQDGIWHLTVKTNGFKQTISARSVMNATGPWVLKTSELLTIPCCYALSLVKGSHLVVPKLYEGNHAYVLQHHDKRIVFVIPYYGFSMIGTTDMVFSGSLDRISISNEEIDYLIHIAASYFKSRLLRTDIVHTWSGVRPLLAGDNEAPQAISRDYTWHFTSEPAPAVTIYGGKITTYRQLARDAVDELLAVFPFLAQSTTANSLLPGACLGTLNYDDYLQYADHHYHWLDKKIRNRLLATYGTQTESILSQCRKIGDLGQDFGHGLFQREVDYLREEEWAFTSEDILWRRTKLGLCFSNKNKEQMDCYLGINATAQSSI